MNETEIRGFFTNHAIKGFLAHDEGMALYKLALSTQAIGPCLEIGSYCGKSTVYLGAACQIIQNTLYAVDHHRGSEEHQLGEEYHDPELFNTNEHKIDTFPEFRRTVQHASLDNTVIPIVASSENTVKHWQTPLGLVFIDGGHSHEMAMNDCVNWAKKIAVGGYLAVHDIYPTEAEGGQGPRLAFEAVLATGKFERCEQTLSLGILKKIHE